VLRTRIARWLRAAIVVAAIFAAWLAIGILTYNDDLSVDAILSGAAGFTK
jgi:hypothetical protein